MPMKDWDERYAAESSLWSGRANGVLVSEMRGRRAGRALKDFGAPVDVIVIDEALEQHRAKVRGRDGRARTTRVVAES
jgi:hypothetical protein